VYNKNKIDHLFTAYIETGNDETFIEFIEACENMIRVIVARYSNYRRFRDDIVQDVKIKIWENFRDRERLSRYLINPSVYLFFRIRSYVATACANYKKVYGLEWEESLSSGTKILSMVQGSYLSPEDSYIMNVEFPRELYDRCAQGVEACMEYRGTDGKAGAVLVKVKDMIEEELGLQL